MKIKLNIGVVVAEHYTQHILKSLTTLQEITHNMTKTVITSC